MPLLEINQIRHISAAVRLDESTAAQVDRYAPIIQASADDVVDKNAPEQPAKKLATGVEPTASVRAVEGVIRQSISRRSQNGASHRENVDTPPLAGTLPRYLVSR